MALEINDTTYIEAIWFAAYADMDADMMVFVYREGGDPKWKLRVRFKYYASDHPFDKNDKRRGYSIKHQDLSKILETVEQLYAMGYKEGFLRHHEKVTIQAKGQDASDKMLVAAGTVDWMHVKQEKVKP